MVNLSYFSSETNLTNLKYAEKDNETNGLVISEKQIFTLILPYSCILLLAVLGNTLVIVTLGVNRRMRTVTNTFLLNLAISDLLLGVFCMPFTLVGVLFREFIFGAFMCRLIPYLQGKFSLHFAVYYIFRTCIFRILFCF